MADGHGGARPGAGRTPKAEKYEPEITAAERKIADEIPDLLEHELAIATGGAERIEECWELALSVTVEDTRENPSGTIVKIKRQLFPKAQPDEMVLVSKKVITPEPDRAAIEYLIDRILGKPTQSTELSGKLELDDVSLTDEGRAGRIAALLDACRTRRDGPAAAE